MTDEQATTEVAEPTAYTKAEQAHYEQICQREREVGKLAGKADETKRTASAAKKAFEAADEELREFIRVAPELQQKLPGEAPVAEKSKPNDSIRVRLVWDIVNEADDTLASAGEEYLALTDDDGRPYLIDPSDDERVYLEAGEFEVVA